MSKPTTIPFLDLQAQYRTIKDEIHEAIGRVLDTSTYALGPSVEHFEQSFASYCETTHAVGCSSGTAALHMALRALEIGPGDEVITVAHTFIATVWPILYCGATPVFVDVDARTRTMDPAQLESRITPRTRAVIPVHLYGHPADMDSIMEVAKRHGVAVVEDAAQAHGARYKGKRVGGMGDMGCFSFYPGKNLGAYGEAGAVVTNDAGLAQKLRMLRDHGQPEKYRHQIIGYNYRMDGIQGAVLDVKLKHLDKWNEARRAAAAEYDQQLKDVPEVALPAVADWAEPVFHLYVIQHSKRDRLQRALREKGIQTGLHYPIPVHRQQALEHLNLEDVSLPVTERLASGCLSLPIYAEIEREMIEHVCRALIVANQELKRESAD